MTARVTCAHCGVALDPEGARRCDCRRPITTNLVRVVSNAAAIARALPERLDATPASHFARALRVATAHERKN